MHTKRRVSVGCRSCRGFEVMGLLTPWKHKQGRRSSGSASAVCASDERKCSLMVIPLPAGPSHTGVGGSFEHEGPATRMLQYEVICQALTIPAFTSSCQANLGSLPSWKSCNSTNPSSWSPLPLSMPPGNPCRAGGWHLRRKPSAVSSTSFFLCGISASRSRDLVVCTLHSYLLWDFHKLMWSVTEFRRLTRCFL